MASGGVKRKASQSFLDCVAEFLECPVCLKTIKDPPIYLCEKGHGLCSTCREPLKAEDKPCPVCRGKLIDARNVALEKMLEKLPKIKCKYEGCTFERSDVELVRIHEDEDCKEKPVKCELCPESIVLSKLFSHLEINHGKTPCRDTKLGSGWNVWTPREALDDIYVSPLIKINDLEFIINRKCYDANVTMFWVSLCGTPKQAKQYEYTYTIRVLSSADFKAGREKYILVGIGDCISCTVSHEDVKKNAVGALLFSRKMLEKEAEEDDEKKLRWKVVINKK